MPEQSRFEALLGTDLQPYVQVVCSVCGQPTVHPSRNLIADSILYCSQCGNPARLDDEALSRLRRKLDDLRRARPWAL